MVEDFEVTMERREGYRFEVDLGVRGTPSLVMDEPPPLGDGDGPNAARLLAAAVGNCLSSSALFCLGKARIDVLGMRTTVRTTLGRNETGRVRIRKIDVGLHPEVAPEDSDRIGRCLDLFEDFCMVTESVRGGIPIDVTVDPTTPAERQASPA
ncbi:MAG: OsmC family protein [Gemmatimonadota bacterium]|nr:OsmC family protein [Gemmatimonadota bacterium]